MVLESLSRRVNDLNKPVLSIFVVKIERVPSGIPGLDSLIEGGFVRGSSTLISGGTGTGKTIFCMQFLYNGATKYSEPGVFLSFEEDPVKLRMNASRFGWDLEKQEKAKKLAILYEEPYQFEHFMEALERKVKEYKAKRLVIDSTSVFGLCLESQHEVRMRLFDLVRNLKKLDVTSLLTAEILEDSKGLSRFGVEEFVVDGVVRLYYTTIGTETFGNIEIRKMRTTKNVHGIFPTKICDKGLEVGAESAVLIK